MAHKYPIEWTKPYAEDTRRRLLAKYGNANPAVVVRAVEAVRGETADETVSNVRKVLGVA
jgi:hypothetical protein